MYSTTNINATLSSTVEPLWLSCHALQNEMILTCPGRRIFPTLEYSVTGLEPTKLYSMCMRLELVDNKKLRYVEGSYTESISTEKKDAPRKVWHKHGVQSGSFWMNKAVNFDQIRITNKKSVEDKSPSFVHLLAQHRYIPVLSIHSGDQKVQEFKLPHTLFIAVTSYHNSEVGIFKTNSNPYATGSRMDRRLQREVHTPTVRVTKKAKKEVTPDVSSMLNMFGGQPALNTFLPNMAVPSTETTDSTPSSPFSANPTTNPFLSMMCFMNPFMSMGFPMQFPPNFQFPNPTDCFPTPSPSITPTSVPSSPNSAPVESSVFEKAIKIESEEEIDIV